MSIPRFGKPANTRRRYRLRLGAYAVLLRDNRMLITRQDTPESEFQLPGGGIDPDESPLQALHREVCEETGWHIANPRRLGSFRRFTYMPEYGFWAEKLCHVYLARPVLEIGPPTEAGHMAIWVPPSLATEMLTNEGDRHFTQYILGRLG